MFRSIWRLLETRDKIRFTLLVLGIIVTSLWNVGGIASVMPLIELLVSPAGTPPNAFVANVAEFFAIEINEDTVVILGVVVLGLFVTGNFLLAFVTWRSIDFARTVAYSLSRRLFSTYIWQDYGFYLNHNSSELMKNIFGELNNIVSGVLKPLVELLVEGVLAAGIVLFLVLVNPTIAAIAAAILGGGYGAIFLLFRTILNRASRERVRRNRDRFRIVGDAFGAIKEIKLMGVESRYASMYESSAYRLERAKVRIQVIAKLPRYVLEVLAFGGILALALILYVTGRNAASVLPLLSAYVFAGYKLLPALQRVFSALANIRGSHASVELVVGELQRSVPRVSTDHTKSEVRFEREIVLDHVGFAYEKADRPALNDINLRIPKNTTIGIAGPTGCGKTTLVDVILGLHGYQQGRLMVDETLLEVNNLRSWRKHFGYVPQAIYLSDASVTHNIAFGEKEEAIDHDRVRFVAELANLHGFVLTLQNGYDTELGERGVRLSGGQRQRVGIARALYRDPDILVFDEATSALDTHTEQAVMEAIQKLMHKKTIIIIAHRLSTLESADNIIVLKDGYVDAEGPYADLIRDHPHFALS